MAGSGWMSFHCCGTRVRFYYDISVRCRLLACGSLFHKLCFLIRIRLANCAFHRVRVPSWATPCVCVFSFFHPFHSSDLYSYFLFVVTKFGGVFCLRGLRKASGRSGSSINRERNIRISCSTPSCRLTNLAPFWFFLVTGNSALITSRLSSFCGLQVSVQPSTLQFSSYVRSVHARASDVHRFHFLSII